MNYTEIELYYNIFFAIRISRDNDVTIVFAPPLISALSRISSRNVLGYVYFSACLLVCEVSQKSICEESVKMSYLLDVSANI